MRRLLLLALGLSALLWTAARTVPLPLDEVTATSSVESLRLTDDLHETGESDQQWQTQHYPIAAVTQSLWKSAIAHAEMGGTCAALAFDRARAASSPDPPAFSSPTHLRHTPLLI